MKPGSSCSKTWILIGLALFATAGVAQRTANTPNTPPRPGNPNRAPTTPEIVQPTFISGKVLLEGGGSLPEPVAIERICNGVVRREGYTDFKGQFEFQLGSNMAFQDASENDSRLVPNSQTRTTTPGGRRLMDLSGCEFRAVLAGYHSTIVSIRATGETWQYELGTIFMKRMGDAPGTTVSVTSMGAPKSAMRAYEKAQKARQEKPIDAEKDLRKAVEIYPQFAAAWNLLGDMDRLRMKFDLARDEYKRATYADPQFVNPLYGLTMIAMQERKWAEAVHLSDQVLKLNAAAFPAAYFFNAAANYNQQRFDVAEESAKKFKALDTQHTHPDVCLLLSYIYSRKGEYAGAAREIRDYLVAQPNAAGAEALTAEAKRFEDLSVSAKRN
jgi:hypothetical protein